MMVWSTVVSMRQMMSRKWYLLTSATWTTDGRCRKNEEQLYVVTFAVITERSFVAEIVKCSDAQLTISHADFF